MYQFPVYISNDEKANTICFNHINNILINMLQRHINHDTNTPTRYAYFFFPKELRHDINAMDDKYMTLYEILKDKKEIEPELLLLYVLAHVISEEENYVRSSVIEALDSVINNDELHSKMTSMYNKNNDDSSLLEYNFEQIETNPIEYFNFGNFKKNDEEKVMYYYNIRKMIKEMIDKVNNKKGKYNYTKKEALKFIRLIEEGVIKEDIFEQMLLNEDLPEIDFVFDMYVKKYGHPAVYRLPKNERKYVMDMIKIDISNELGEKDMVISSYMLDMYVNEIITFFEDTRLYLKSQYIFENKIYEYIDIMGLNQALDYVINFLGEDPSITGIKYF